MAKPISRGSVVAVLLTALLSRVSAIWKDQPQESHYQIVNSRRPDLHGSSKMTLMVIAFVEGEVGANRSKTSRTDLSTSMYERLVGTEPRVNEPDIVEICG